MDYVVLARKLRPARFDELIGQETVVRALTNAIKTGRLAHAYLFTGSRGVGKTSTARILTKAFNCENPDQGEPCNACQRCLEIARNASPDVYEIDAASNRGIDNIRELRENTSYVPVNCPYKTYIIDEVHMLTTESFNALLKTLEEPPPHVKFILATTSPHRIPDTILSRCQRYDFSRVPVPRLAGYLAEISNAEGIQISGEALEAIARNAAGGVRDALTALDQVIAFAGNNPGDDQVWRVLGLSDNREVLTLLGAVLSNSLHSALEIFAASGERGHDPAVLLEALIGEVKDFSLFHALGGDADYFSGHPPDTRAFFKQYKEQVTLDQLQQLFYLLLEVESQFKRSEFAQACFEMGLVKACRIEPLVGVPELLERARRMGGSGGKGGAEETGPPPGSDSGGARPPPSSPPLRHGGSPGAEQASEPPARQAPAPAAPLRTGESAVPDPSGDPEENARAPARQSPPTPAAADQSPTPSTAQSLVPELRKETSSQPGPAQASQPGPTPSPPPDGDREDPPLPGKEPGTDLGPLEPARCDDERWNRLAASASAAGKMLGTKMRRLEVEDIGEDFIAVLPPDETSVLSTEDLEALRPLLDDAFSPAFHIRFNDDKKKVARFGHTIAGRNQLREEARLAGIKSTAENDDNVQRLLQVFPKGKVVDISINDPSGAQPGAGAALNHGREDV